MLETALSPYPVRQTARWCNGSTSDSGSLSQGSNPCRANSSLRRAEFPRLGVDGQVESIQIHHLVPRRRKVPHERRLGVVAAVELRDGSEVRVRTEDEVDGRCRPL